MPSSNAGFCVETAISGTASHRSKPQRAPLTSLLSLCGWRRMHWLQTSTELGKIASQCASLRLLALSRVAMVKDSTEIGRAQFECAQGWAGAWTEARPNYAGGSNSFSGSLSVDGSGRGVSALHAAESAMTICKEMHRSKKNDSRMNTLGSKNVRKA